MATARKNTVGFFDLFPDSFKVAVIGMGAAVVLGAVGLTAYQIALDRPAATLASEPITYEGVRPIESLAQAGQEGQTQPGEKKTEPVFGAGSYTVTTPSGLNVRYEPGVTAERTGGKVWGSGVKVTKTKLVDGDTWGKLAGGGWIAMEYDGVEYVVSDKEVR